jgi:uncharacterized phage protein gp47/JayE
MTTEIKNFSDLYANGQTKALLRSSRLTTLSWTPGYMIDIVTGLAATIGEEASRIAVELNAKHYFSQASGDDLDTLALDHYKLRRNDGVSAVGIARFSRAGVGAGNVSIPAGAILETADGLQFVTTNSPLMTGLEIDANIAAVVPGSSGIVAADTIVVINPLSALSDASVQVTNPEGTAGGSEEETDAEFRVRIIAWFATLRRGTTLAIETGALWTGAVKNAVLDESVYPPTVYIADVTGGANVALEAAVQAELVNWRSAGIQVNVVGASVITQPITVALTFSAGSDTSSVRDQVEAAIIAEISTLDIGETLYTSSIVSAAKSIEGVLDCVVSNPAGDVVPAANELIRAGLVTI